MAVSTAGGRQQRRWCHGGAAAGAAARRAVPRRRTAVAARGVPRGWLPHTATGPLLGARAPAAPVARPASRRASPRHRRRARHAGGGQCPARAGGGAAPSGGNGRVAALAAAGCCGEPSAERNGGGGGGRRLFFFFFCFAVCGRARCPLCQHRMQTGWIDQCGEHPPENKPVLPTPQDDARARGAWPPYPRHHRMTPTATTYKSSTHYPTPPRCSHRMAATAPAPGAARTTQRRPTTTATRRKSSTHYPTPPRCSHRMTATAPAPCAPRTTQRRSAAAKQNHYSSSSQLSKRPNPHHSGVHPAGPSPRPRAPASLYWKRATGGEGATRGWFAAAASRRPDQVDGGWGGRGALRAHPRRSPPLNRRRRLLHTPGAVAAWWDGKRTGDGRRRPKTASVCLPPARGSAHASRGCGAVRRSVHGALRRPHPPPRPHPSQCPPARRSRRAAPVAGSRRDYARRPRRLVELGGPSRQPLPFLRSLRGVWSRAHQLPPAVLLNASSRATPARPPVRARGRMRRLARTRVP